MADPTASPSAPMGGPTYDQDDQSEAARRSRVRTTQHLSSEPTPGEQGPDPFGEGGFAAVGYGQSGYGGESGQLEGSQRTETPAQPSKPEGSGPETGR